MGRPTAVCASRGHDHINDFVCNKKLGGQPEIFFLTQSAAVYKGVVIHRVSSGTLVIRRLVPWMIMGSRTDITRGAT